MKWRTKTTHFDHSHCHFRLFTLTLLILSTVSVCHSYLKYTEHSCTDLIPKAFNDVTHSEQISPSKIMHSKWRRKKRSASPVAAPSPSNVGVGVGYDYGHMHDFQTQLSPPPRVSHENYNSFDQVPFKLRMDKMRYKRDSDVRVYINGSTNFDGLILQTRAVPGTSDSYVGTGIGVVGQFEGLRRPYKYLTCFDLPYGTVIDGGHHEGMLSNASFLWHSPDHNVGDIHFVASVLRGINYWTLVSSTLTFNPFRKFLISVLKPPEWYKDGSLRMMCEAISSYSCGSTVACFRVCPLDVNPCLPREALYVFTYHADYLPNGQVEFTIGGRISNNNSYIAIAFGNEYDTLLQAEMIACHIHNGQAKLKHLLIESLYLPPQEPQHVDNVHPMEVADYDLDRNMLWCRFRRPMSPETIMNPRLNLYHFHFWGSTDYFHQHFHLPRREFIYSTKFKRNLTTPYNEIIAGASINGPSFCLLVGIASFIVAVTLG